MFSRGGAIALVLVIFAGACVEASFGRQLSSASSPKTPPAPEDPPADEDADGAFSSDIFAYGDCPFVIPPRTNPRCGVLTVPEDRDNPQGPDVQIAVAIFPAINNTSEPPLVYLEGGPGGEILKAIVFAYEPLFAALNEDRTLVVFDQRGTGYSDPNLRCPEVLEVTFDLLDDNPDVSTANAAYTVALDGCRARWLELGIDLSQYNSADSASDVADLRVALGYDEWDLFGVSYGTRLALTVMRDHPQGVRSVILDSTYPPEVDGVSNIPSSAARAFGELFRACDADDLCQAQYGDLETLLFSVVDDLNDSPADVTLTDLFTGDLYPSVLDGASVLGLVFESLYSDQLIVDIPVMLAGIATGDMSLVERLASLSLANSEFFAIGQYFSVQCHEEVPYADPSGPGTAVAEFPRMAAIVEGAFTQSELAFEFCEYWDASVGSPIEAEAVLSDIPALVLAGQFDPITPPSDGLAVAERLEAASFVEYPGLGHGVAVAEGCPLSITLQFLRNPLDPIDTSCVAAMLPLLFNVD